MKKNEIIKNISNRNVDLAYDNSPYCDFEYFCTLRPGEEIQTRHIKDGRKVKNVIRINDGLYIYYVGDYIKYIEYTPFNRFEIMDI